MKNKFLITLASIIGICSLSFSCGKEEKTPQPDPSINLSYNLINDGTAYEVSGLGTCLDTEIVIPEKIDDIPVVSIGESAFESRYSLTGIILPNTITNIGKNAFFNCYSLLNITLPKNLSKIEKDAFLGCYKLIEICNLSSLNVVLGSDTNGSVGSYAKNLYTKSTGKSFLSEKNGFVLYKNDVDLLLMGYNGSNTNLVIPKGVTEIYNYALLQSPIKSLSVAESLTSLKAIGDYAFWHCENMTTIEFSTTLESIGEYAFYGCTNLTNISFPESLVSIGDYAFYASNSLTDLSFGPSLKEIGRNAFEQCANLKRVSFTNSTNWFISSIKEDTNKDSISIISPEIGADYLTETYVNKYWEYSDTSEESSSES